MKKSLFIAFVLSVIASGSIYANDLSNVKHFDNNAKFTIKIIADAGHSPFCFGDVAHPHKPHKPHRPHKPHKVVHSNCCPIHCHCCPPPAPHKGKPHKFNKWSGHHPAIDKDHRPKGSGKGGKYAPPKGPGRGNKGGGRR